MAPRKHLTLERILHSQGFGTRRECRALVRHKQVCVENTMNDDPDHLFDPTGLSFSVAGTPWIYQERAYLMLNKPTGYECSQKPRHHLSVYTLLPEPLVLRGVQSVGRLDEDTTGLLLFSDDGQFIHRMASPKWKVNKVYRVGVRHPLDAAQLAALRQGVVLHDEPEPVVAVACAQLDDLHLELTLAEGKYHQVKRMLAAVGNRVETLTRIAMGGLALPADLAPGAWRWLDAEALVSVQRVSQTPE
ncbi:MAG: 16S rRNA pseudouridine(516) synthase [Betaproteobacteria bacterium]|nr:16S rRNA pseudouridine(516) synthase [Betaproteobacteria bacterium]